MNKKERKKKHQKKVFGYTLVKAKENRGGRSSRNEEDGKGEKMRRLYVSNCGGWGK